MKCLSNRLEHIKKEIGHFDVTEIRLYDVQNVLNKFSKQNPYTNKPSAKKTISGYISAISMCFDYMVANRVIYNNPLTLLKAPKNAVQKKRSAITYEQINWIKETEHRAQLPYMIMLYCGLRRGEITALEWKDIDLKNKTISVTKSYDNIAKEVKPPKTKNSVRVVPIPDLLLSYLEKQSRKNKLVFPNTVGGYMTDHSWQELHHSYMRTLNIKYGKFDMPPNLNKKVPISIDMFTPHQLRHTYATLLYDAGVDVITAKYLLGHSDVKTTLQIYTDLSNKNKEKNIDKFNDYLSSF